MPALPSRGRRFVPIKCSGSDERGAAAAEQRVAEAGIVTRQHSESENPLSHPNAKHMDARTPCIKVGPLIRQLVFPKSFSHVLRFFKMQAGTLHKSRIS